MKKVWLLSLLFGASVYASEEKIIVATDGTYPPFSEMDDKGQMIGFDIDIAKALCAQMQVQCEFKQIEFDGLIAALKTGKADALVASLNANDERRKSVAFSKPYYGNPGVFVRAKGSNLEFDKASLKGKVIGVLRGTTFDEYASHEMKDWGLTINRYASQEEANLDMRAGRVDVLFADKIALQDGFLDREGGEKFELFGDELNDEKYFGEGIAIAVRKDEPQLAQRFSDAIEAIVANGEYKKVNDRYFSYDIYDVIAHPPAAQ